MNVKVLWSSQLVLVYVVACAILGLTDSNIQEYCEYEVFNASCAVNEVILMSRAKYGRMQLGRCAEHNYGYLGCTTDALLFMDERCSGLHECSVRISELFLSEGSPCPFDLRTFLEAAYECVKVQTPEDEICNSASMLVSDEEGYLSNVVTKETGCGGFDSPWVITAQPGQTINLYLLDFTQQTRNFNSQVHCYVYGVVKEWLHANQKSKTVCGTSSRESLVYSSTTNQIQVRFTLWSQSVGDMPHYVFKYEVIGCPNFTPPPDSDVRHEGDRITVTCLETREVFYLACVGRRWIGHLGSCSQIETKSERDSVSEEENSIGRRK